MTEHELEGTTCWCSPSEDFIECDDNGTMHQHHIVTHHNEQGDILFVIEDDDCLPTCPDCGDVLEAFIPDPALWRGHISMHAISPGTWRTWGAGLSKAPDEAWVLRLNWGSTEFIARMDGKRRPKSVGEKTAELAPNLIAEVEEHLRSHG